MSPPLSLNFLTLHTIELLQQNNNRKSTQSPIHSNKTDSTKKILKLKFKFIDSLNLQAYENFLRH